MSEKHDVRETSNEMRALNRLFGRDMAADGWVVKCKPRRVATPRSQERRAENAPDAAMIWALRGRRR
jgi:hypothetical protein